MTERDTTVLLPKVLMYALAAVSVTLSVWLCLTMLYFRSGDASARTGSRIYLPSGTAKTATTPLFRFEWRDGGLALQPVGEALMPSDGSRDAGTLQAGQSATMLIGRYWYRFRLSLSHDATGAVQHALDWELLGVRLRIGDELGRAPDFVSTGRLAYDPDPSTHKVSLWVDAMPTSAFRVRPPRDCQGTAVCLEVTAGGGRITVERDTVPVQIHHARPGERVGLNRRDRLWVGHLNYVATPVADAQDLFDFRISNDFAKYRGDRRGLGHVGFHDAAGPLDITSSIEVNDVTSQFRTGRLSDLRWNPQTEDEYQLLTDLGLLCVEMTGGGQRVLPQLVWADAANPGCYDPVDGTRRVADAILPNNVLDIYRRRRAADRSVVRTNEILRSGTTARPEDIPFVFEWWPVSTAGAVAKIPVSLWGVRTVATRRQLDPEEDESAHELSRGDRPVVLQSSRRRILLAQTTAGHRAYAPGPDLLGLGPLLGIRGSLDGLDEVVPSIPSDAAPDEIRLTIDPDLQAKLWTTLKQGASEFSTDPGPRRLYGLSAVALNGLTGDVLAILNWPDALKWETPKDFAAMTNQSSWGVPQNSTNVAMLRTDKIGSVFKLLAMYSMADAGVLDATPLAGNPHWCDRYPFRVVETSRDGRVASVGGSSPFHDNQMGPLPVRPSGLNGGLERAAAASCNSYFALAAFMLLNESTPETVWLDDCPVDASGRRTDVGRASSRQWIVCTQRFARRRQSAPEHWLLLPIGDRLDTHGVSGFKAAGTRATGYFARALDSGYRFELRGQGEMGNQDKDSYQGVKFFDGWMPNLPNAEGRVFEYPTMLSPRSHFGAADQNGRHIAGVDDANGWRAFVSQAIGEAGQGSALSVAALYAGVARGDGQIPAPRLLVTTADPLLRTMFAFEKVRQERLEAALKAPLALGGTAFTTVGRLSFRANVLGKTGTFTIEHDPDGFMKPGTPSPTIRAGCGVLEVVNAALRPRGASTLFGTSVCEHPQLMITSIHRYPEGPQPTAPQAAPKNKSRPVPEPFTSFAAIVRGPAGSSVPPIVFVLISDMDEYSHKGAPRAARFVGPLLTDIWEWMQAQTS